MRSSSKRRSRRIVVDTCLGNDKQGRRIPTWNNLQGPFLADLAAAGYPRESIDTVLCTHLHVDHVGWNTMLVDGQWVPTFPQARYLMGRVEFEHWRSQHERDDMAAIFAELGEAGATMPGSSISSRPIIGCATRSAWCRRRAIRPGMSASSSGREGEEALITGDFIHHPCQIAHPEWSSTADSDPEAAHRTRDRMLKELPSGRCW